MIIDHVLMILMPFMMAAMVVLALLAGGASEELNEKAPEYARKLYRSFSYQMLNRASPVDGAVLFFSPVPPAVKSAVTAMRIAYAIQFSLAAAFVGILLFAIL